VRIFRIEVDYIRLLEDVCLLRLLCGAGGYPPNVLQPTAAYCTNPALVPPSSSEALHIRKREMPLLAREGTMDEKWPIKFSLKLRISR
jgi:hypothetical protein